MLSIASRQRQNLPGRPRPFPSASPAAGETMLDLPDELLLMICSLLSAEDKLSVRNSCRRLRDIASDPSLWHAVALSYRGPPDDPRLKSCLTLSVPHTRKFALTAESVFKCATSKGSHAH